MQFEALFIGMMLKSARDARLGNGLLDGGDTQQYLELMDQQVALELARGGGLGFGKSLVEQLTRRPLCRRRRKGCGARAPAGAPAGRAAPTAVPADDACAARTRRRASARRRQRSAPNPRLRRRRPAASGPQRSFAASCPTPWPRRGARHGAAAAARAGRARDGLGRIVPQHADGRRQQPFRHQGRQRMARRDGRTLDRRERRRRSAAQGRERFARIPERRGASPTTPISSAARRAIRSAAARGRIPTATCMLSPTQATRPIRATPTNGSPSTTDRRLDQALAKLKHPAVEPTQVERAP